MGLKYWRLQRAAGAVAVAVAAAGASVVPVWAAVTWETAVPAAFGAGVQSTSPNAFLNSVSCMSPGNCTAVGRVKDAAGGAQAFTQTMTGGVWAEAVLATFGAGVQSANPDDSFNSVSCVSAGNCVAAGRFRDADGSYQAFTQTMTGGVWATATPATFGTGVQRANPNGFFNAVMCVSVGNCVAAGRFVDVNNNSPAFTQTMTGGVWADAVPVVFAAGVESTTPYAVVYSVSCASAGNCTIAGQFKDPSDKFEGFTQTMAGGVWADAVPVEFAGGVQNTEPGDSVSSVSCVSVGNCTVVGSFKDADGNYQAFSQTSTGGTWADALPAAFAAGVQNVAPNGYLNSVSCVSVGNCTAVGSFKDADGNYQAFTQTMTGGVWAVAVPAAFAAGVQSATPSANLKSVSCVSAGNCTAVGSFKDAEGNYQAFTQTMTGGVWADAVPAVFAAGVQRVNPDAVFNSVSCVSAGYCTAVGNFKDPGGYRQAFAQSMTGPVLPPTGAGTARAVVVALLLLVVGVLLASARRAGTERGRPGADPIRP